MNHLEIVDRPAFTVVGLLIETSPMSADIPALWAEFGQHMHEIPYLAEPGVSYGLMAYDADSGRLAYMAGCWVSEVAELPSGMTTWAVPANQYAVFETTLPAIAQTFDSIYNSWLPQSGYRLGPGPQFERYGQDFHPDAAESKLTIYIPVAGNQSGAP